MEITTQSAIIISATITSIITIVGWITNSYLARKHEIAKKKLDFRQNMLQLVLSISALTISRSETFDLKEDKELISSIEAATINIQIYGFEDEFTLFQKFTESINNRDIEKTRHFSQELFLLIIPRIREELGFPKII